MLNKTINQFVETEIGQSLVVALLDQL